MIRRPPRSTPTYTLFPYTTLFRSCDAGVEVLTTGCLGVCKGPVAMLPIGDRWEVVSRVRGKDARARVVDAMRSEEHTSELQSLMRISYAVFCLKKKTINHQSYR